MENISQNQYSPNIIFNLKGFVYGDKSKENQFVRCKNSFNIVGYISRKEAEKRNNSQDLSVADKDYFEIDNAWNIASYATLRPGSAGAFSKNSTSLDKNDLKEVMKKLRTTKSTIWTGVLSFTPLIANQFCNSKEQAQKILNDHLPVLFKNSAIDYDNLNLYAAYHVNTQHPHIHLIFWEEHPTRIDSKGKITYNYNNPSRKPYLPKDCLSDFKFSIAKSFEENNEYLLLRDKVRQSVKDNFINGDYTNLLTELYLRDRDIIDSSGKQYGRLSSEQKSRIDKSVNSIIDANPDTRKLYSQYTSYLMQAHLQNIKILNENNMPIPERAKNFYDNRLNELKNRLGNEYLKNMKQFALSHYDFEQSKSLILKPYAEQSSSSYMRSIRKFKKPYQNSNNSILKNLEQAVKDEVIVFRNNLDKYFAELKEKGVDLIYEEEVGQSTASSSETFE